MFALSTNTQQQTVLATEHAWSFSAIESSGAVHYSLRYKFVYISVHFRNTALLPAQIGTVPLLFATEIFIYTKKCGTMYVFLIR
jgi:hypothetical protein